MPLLLADAELAALLEALPGVLIDPPALSELCRLFSAAVSTPQVRWAGRLEQWALPRGGWCKGWRRFSRKSICTRDPACYIAGGAQNTVCSGSTPGVTVCSSCVHVPLLPSLQGCSIWLPVLLQPHSLAWLLHIISNALHPLLLQRSLELAAVLLAVGEDAAAGADADAAHPAQDGSPSIQQEQQQSGQRPPQAAQCTASAANQLLQQGLMPALHAVLAPAAAPGAKLQAYSTTSAAQTHPAAAAAEGGSWSDEDNDGGGGAADEEKGTVQSRVYEQPDVLMALLSALEQLGQQPDTVAAAMQQLPELPELLLQLLLACHAREQQEVLETLLPVLVLFRVGVLAVLQPAACEEQQQQQQQEQKRCIQCLQLWACIAGVLLDSAPDSLDARDAAWYLLAAVSPSFERVFAGISAVYAASSCLQQQVQLLRRCVSEGGAPDTSRGYAQQCDRALCTALPQLLPAEEEAE